MTARLVRGPLYFNASTGMEKTWGGKRRYIKIAVHPTVDELQAAAEKYASKHVPASGRSPSWEGVYACFHPVTYRESYVKGRWRNVNGPYAGMMRFAEDNITTMVAVHECVHAAATIYRQTLDMVVNLADDCGDEEENFAYILGDITDSVLLGLKDAGLL